MLRANVRLVPVVMLVGIMLLSGCGALVSASPTPTPIVASGGKDGRYVDLVQAAGLSMTQLIEIRQLVVEGDRAQYVSKVAISDSGTIDKLLGALADVKALTGASPDSVVVPACVPDYEIVFHRSDGVTATFGFLCGSGAASFIPNGTKLSDGSFKLAGEVRLADSFKELLEQELARDAGVR